MVLPFPTWVDMEGDFIHGGLSFLIPLESVCQAVHFLLQSRTNASNLGNTTRSAQTKHRGDPMFKLTTSLRVLSFKRGSPFFINNRRDGMGLKDLEIDYKYRNLGDNILEELIIPCSKESYRYDRAVGFFSSKALRLALSGIIEFIKKENSKIRILSFRVYFNVDTSNGFFWIEETN